MKRLLISFLAVAAMLSCNPSGDNKNKDNEEPDVPVRETGFAKGADLGWVTEMESKGYKFHDSEGKEMECTALFKSIGFNAVRCRVWVNPEDGWNGREDVLVKAKRAQTLGMDIMIDFHYSDCWADPGKQYPPKAWEKYGVDEMAKAVADHTRDVLSCLKDNDIDVKWVQVGNEVTNGMLWESGRVRGTTAGNFVKYFNAGRDAVKEIYPEALVVLHIDNGWNTETLNWFYGLVTKAGASFDVIGLSLYPSYWDDASSSYPDWKVKVNQCLANLPMLHATYSKPVILTEFGMPASLPEESKEALQCLLDKTSGYDWFGGIFLWEPESEQSRNGYAYGAFKDGAPTIALDPFMN